MPCRYCSSPHRMKESEVLKWGVEMHPEIKTPGRWRQDCEFKVSLSLVGSLCLRKQNAGWAGRLRVLASKPDDLTLSPSTPKTEERNQLTRTVLTAQMSPPLQ